MAKTIVSTPLDDDTLTLLDEFCKRVHRTRAEVLRGLVYALLVDGKQFVYEDWRKELADK